MSSVYSESSNPPSSLPLANSPSASSDRRVLVLGRDDRSLLAIVRSLGRSGCEVHVAWHDPTSIALRSRYVTRVHELPPPDDEDLSWVGAFEGLVEEERIGLVIPADDPATLALSRKRADLSSRTRLAMPGERALAVAYDKLATWETAREVGVPVPRQISIRDATDLERLPAELGWPIVLKPRHSWRFGCRKWEHVVTKAYHAAELRAAWTVLSGTDEVLAQENVPAGLAGAALGVEILAKDGEVVLAYQHQRLHEPPRGGGSSYRKSVALDADLERAARALAKSIDLTGVAMIEFKRDAGTGEFWLIEINARFWGSLPLTVAAGADFPAALRGLFMDGSVPARTDYRQPLYGRNLWRDFWWFFVNRRVDAGEPTLARVGRAELFAELGAIVTLRHRVDSMSWTDPLPGLVEVARVGRAATGLLGRKLRELQRSLGASRRGDRLRAELAAARHVLFVCKGNLCRSPFAERVASLHARPGVQVSSAGYWRQTGRSCPPQALVAARRHGVDLNGHRSRLVLEDDVAWADVVLVFDGENRRALNELFPAHASKVRSVGDLVGRGADVADPWGAGYDTFERTYELIAEALAAPTAVTMLVSAADRAALSP